MSGLHQRFRQLAYYLWRMSINEGTRLGRYEIRSQSGGGEMGEVYLAHRLLTHRGDFLASLRPLG